ncbi:pyruvate dehydrogenase E2 component (dihydrolipoamide acetyltransferase) [Malonomonas rubra DSM 5091]|uniref:Dihydrolipoamide acetyltransferase component of pyruvate dehydrogenase complex n=1 Tax=Malonomonas rubra DSM 5091 TaxID=1122189 RepID=A0A1M6E4A3_MALRU|nr:dihydrolipoamide acetyltransferase family protein [Malonomonas rubra]SHI80332.1 pyruvate dehydrogenase E2 component (dihydrolipoamide acetyltransferase) [Malonomonas rubra DSM 5091]
MAIEIRVPQINAQVNEGRLLKWHVAEGEQVARGEVLAEIEEGSVVIELEATVAGVLSQQLVAENQSVAMGDLLAYFIPDQEEAISAVPPRVSASPAARKLAKELRISLELIDGSGPGGRILLSDVERAYAERTPPAVAVSRDLTSKAVAAGSGKSVKVRRLIARKMEESWNNIPHFYVTMSVDMTDVIRFRKDLGVSINDFVLSATAHALQEHPWVNSLWNGEQGIEQVDVNLQMAVATEHGLYYPVIRNCEDLNLKQLSEEAGILADKASSGKLQKDEMEGGTFTITNMGMLGVESFGALVTPPQAAVLAVGTVKGEVVVDDQGEPAVAPIMKVTLSADHRILDGADAADFLDTLKSYLEAPITLLGDCHC